MLSSPATSPAPRGLRRVLRGFANRVFGRGRGPRPSLQLSLEDLSYAAGQTLRLDELLVRIPAQICGAFQLRDFSIFLRRGATYVQQRTGNARPGEPPPVTLRSSSAVLAQLKRERRLLPLHKAQPDAWTLLADPGDLRQLEDLGAQALLPLPGRTGLVGFASVTSSRSAASLGQHAAELEKLASQIGLGLETAQFQRSLQDEATHRERVNRSLELAREVQERMLPQQLPAEPTLDAAAVYQSAEQVGGDYYDAFRTPGGQICYVIADISGKGVAAALLMATLRSTIRTAMLAGPRLPDLLRTVNAQLYEASAASRYATLAILLYDPATETVASSNAGHNPPLLFQGTCLRPLVCGGPVLGLLPDVTYEHEILPFAPGDALLLYTDGVTEWPDEQGNEWGEEGLLAAWATAPRNAAGPRDASALSRHILTRLHEFAGRVPQVDDVTLLTLVRTEVRA